VCRRVDPRLRAVVLVAVLHRLSLLARFAISRLVVFLVVVACLGCAGRVAGRGVELAARGNIWVAHGGGLDCRRWIEGVMFGVDRQTVAVRRTGSRTTTKMLIV
jgi:hypothetical protein